MNLTVIKVKDKDLFLNTDDINGEYLDTIPMVLEKSEAESTLKYCSDNIWVIYTKDETINKSLLEIKEIEINYK